MINPQPVNQVKLKVLIPTKSGGYTGQRDEWEEYETDREVIVDGDMVTLKDPRPYCKSESISFSMNDLQAAIKALNPNTNNAVTYRRPKE